MNYDLTITDDTGSQTFYPEIPLLEETLEGVTDVLTIDFNLYTDFFANKSLITRSWAYMDAAEYALLKGFYDRQFTLNKYPLITTDGFTSVPMRMTLSPTAIIDNCGTVQNVTVSFRQSVQSSTWSI